VLAIARQNRSGGLSSNQEHFSGGVRVDPGVDAEREALLYDPQTSGGLLIASSAAAAAAVEAALRAAQVLIAVIGTAVAPEPDVQIVVGR
jgi:selenide, water dikinase